jgi:DNA-binding response OmpR family regulator
MATNATPTVLLYVEDTKAIQDMIVSVLEDAGFALLIADNGSDALEILAVEKGAIDGLLTDVDLGKGPTGWDVARRARLRRPKMPVIYASSAGEDDWMINGVPRSRLVAKPFPPSQLLDVLMTVLTSPIPRGGARPILPLN